MVSTVKAGCSLALLFALAATSAACTCAEPHALAILYMIEPEEPPDCTISTTNDITRANGFWDVSFGVGYAISPLLQNSLVCTESMSALVAETNDINLTGFDYRVTAPNGAPGAGAIPPSGFAATSGRIECGGGLFALAGLPFFPSNVADDLAASLNSGDSYEIFVTFRPEGDTIAGRTIRGDDFVYPITICDGCLVFGCFGPQGARSCLPPDKDEVLDFCRLGFDEYIHCSLLGGDPCN